MLGEIKGRVTLLLVAAALVGGAVAIRVWLAATGGYSQESSIPFRVASTVALFGGFLLAALAVAWPMRMSGTATPTKKGGDQIPRNGPGASEDTPPER
jgi:hypothetical protein